MKIKDEIPFTTGGVSVYIEEIKKELERLRPYVNEFNRLKNRLKIAEERLRARSVILAP